MRSSGSIHCATAETMGSACDYSISQRMDKKVSANKLERDVVKAATQSDLHDPETMPSEIASIQSPTSSCNLESLPISSAGSPARPAVAPYQQELMSRSWSLVSPLLAGLVLTA